jgi:hypothetical protein
VDAVLLQHLESYVNVTCGGFVNLNQFLFYQLTLDKHLAMLVYSYQSYLMRRFRTEAIKNRCFELLEALGLL